MATKLIIQGKPAGHYGNVAAQKQQIHDQGKSAGEKLFYIVGGMVVFVIILGMACNAYMMTAGV